MQVTVSGIRTASEGNAPRLFSESGVLAFLKLPTVEAGPRHGRVLRREGALNLRPAILFGAMLLLASGRAFPAVYYVSPDGNNASPGTIDKPFASMQKGHDVAVAGDTVYLRGGTYTFRGQGANSNAGIYITKSGQSDTRRICFFAYKDEKPVLDFSGLSLATSTSAGIRIDGSKWLHFRGLEICNVPQPGGAANNGIWCNPGSNIIFERLNLHHNSGPGLSIAYGEGGHLVLNCDSHHNYDSRSTQGTARTPMASGSITRRPGLPPSYAAAGLGGTPMTASTVSTKA